MEIETSDKGFKFVHFTDIDGVRSVLVDTLSANFPAIWIGMRQWGYIHLSQEHVRQLLPFLTKFVETGRIG
jgi:hypothetical protein